MECHARFVTLRFFRTASVLVFFLYCLLALFAFAFFVFEDNEHKTSSRFTVYALFVFKFRNGLLCFCLSIMCLSDADVLFVHQV